MSDAFAAPLLAALALVSLAGILVAVRDVRRATRARALLAAGRLGEARAAAEALAKSWLRVVPGLRDGVGYVVAVTRHLDGDLDGAITALRSLAEVRDRELRYAVRSLEAATLVLLDRDPARALLAIEEARAIAPRPEDVLVEAHALRSIGRIAAADALVRDAPPVEAATEPALAAAASFFRGAYLLRASADPTSLAAARAALESAEQAAPGTIYARRAEALLASAPASTPEARDDDADDPRSSLAPQMIGRGGSRPP